jgi:division/cell wall cluster transcriptional repressor MraZ
VLSGTFYQQIDNKGRVVVPMRFRSELGEHLVLCRGFGECISVFPYEMWLRIAQRWDEIDPFSEAQSLFRRLFVASAFEVEPDKLGRIQIPKALREAAGIGSRAAGVGEATGRGPRAPGDETGAKHAEAETEAQAARDIAVVGMREFCEIWSKAAWDRYIEEVNSLDVLRELAKDVRWKREMYRRPRPDEAG